MLCSKCGKELDYSDNYCRSCGKRVGEVSEIPPAPRLKKSQSQPVLEKALSTGFLIIVAGAILLLIALSQDWYTVRCTGADCAGYENQNLDFELLTDSDFLESLALNWFGVALSHILMVSFASIPVFAAVFAIATGRRLKQIWTWLAFLSVAALIANFLYLLLALNSKGIELAGSIDSTLYVTPHAGWVLAFLGAVAIGIGSRKLKTALT